MKHREPGQDDLVDLADFDDAFAAASSSPAVPPVTDGPYLVRIEHVEITRGKRSGHALLKWRLRILGPTFAGRLLWHNHVLTTTLGLRWLKHDLDVCGLELLKLSDLPTHTERLLGLELEITQRTRGPWSNLYFNRRLPSRESSRDRCPF